MCSNRLDIYRPPRGGLKNEIYIEINVLTLSASILAVSCGDFISNIQVKGSPTFCRSQHESGDIEYLSIADIREMMYADSPDAELQVYEYPFERALSADDPEDFELEQDNTMRFLVHYPLTSIDLDFGQYLADLNFEDSISADMPAQSFTVPDIEDPDPQTVDFNAQLLAVLNAIPAVPAVPVVLSAGTGELPVELTLPGFDTASFSAGEMVLDFSSAPSNLTLTSVTLQNGTTIKASGTGLPVALSGATSVSIPLTGTTDLANEVRIVLGLTASAPTTGTLKFRLAFADSTRLDAATGVSLDPVSVEIPNVSIPAINDATFVQAVVGNGSIDLTIGPSSETGDISGFTRELDLEIAQTGGLSASLVNNTSENPSVPLAGEIINANSINLSGEITLSATNASFKNSELPVWCHQQPMLLSIVRDSNTPGAGFDSLPRCRSPSDDMSNGVFRRFTEVGLDLTLRTPAGIISAFKSLRMHSAKRNHPIVPVILRSPLRIPIRTARIRSSPGTTKISLLSP